MTPDGDLYLLPPAPGEPPPPELTNEEQDEIHLHRVTRMLGIWAREVQRAAHSYYQAAVKADWTDRAIEYMEDWSPTERDLKVALEEVWVRGYHLIMGMHQLEQWLSLRQSLTANGDDADVGEDDGDDELARVLRHTIEHLSDARFSIADARRDPSNEKWKNPNIDKLPGGKLSLGFGPGNHEFVFGLVEVRKLFEKAKRYAYVDTPSEEYDFEPSDIDYEIMEFGYDEGP